MLKSCHRNHLYFSLAVVGLYLIAIGPFLVDVVDGQRSIFSLGKRVKKRFGSDSSKITAKNGNGYSDDDEEEGEQHKSNGISSSAAVAAATAACFVSAAYYLSITRKKLFAGEKQKLETFNMDRPQEDGE